MIDAAMMEELIRDGLDVPDGARLSSTEIMAAANDGYKEVSSRAFCIEREISAVAKTGERIIAFTSHRLAQVELLSALSGAGYIFADSTVADWEATESYQWDEEDLPDPAEVSYRSLLHIAPYMLGWLPIGGDHPQYWFAWGNMLVVDPAPLGNYLFRLYVHDYPAAAMLAGVDYPIDLPEAFQPVVVDFALYIIALKLRRFRTAARNYNRYLLNLAMRRRDYLDRKKEQRSNRDVPSRAGQALPLQ